MARAPIANKDTGVTFKEQMCEGRDESSATDRATAHVPSHVVAKQDTPNDHTDGATEEIIVRPVKKEAFKQKSGLIASKMISKDASSSAGKLDPVKHKVCWHHIVLSRIMINFTVLKSLMDISNAGRTPSLCHLCHGKSSNLWL